MAIDLDRVMQALLDRHASALRRTELLKAIRALSARYVERRAELPGRSALDSDGKRAAFAVFYAPLHLITTREIVHHLGLDSTSVRRVIDLGCGTGAAGAGVAAALATAGFAGRTEPRSTTAREALNLTGVDAHPWAVAEANWTWRTIGLNGRATRGDLVRAAQDLARSARPHSLDDTVIVLGWSVNELDAASRARLLPLLLDLHRADAAVLVVEPIARTAVPWWDDWAGAIVAAGGRADEWRFPAALPKALADLDEAAGFRRDTLTGRTCFVTRRSPGPT